MEYGLVRIRRTPWDGRDVALERLCGELGQHMPVLLQQATSDRIGFNAIDPSNVLVTCDTMTECGVPMVVEVVFSGHYTDSIADLGKRVIDAILGWIATSFAALGALVNDDTQTFIAIHVSALPLYLVHDVALPKPAE